MVSFHSGFALLLCVSIVKIGLATNADIINRGCPAGDEMNSMNEEARAFVVEYANFKRSIIAKNFAPMNLGQGYSKYPYAPPAVNMKKLIYNCTIETVAYHMATFTTPFPSLPTNGMFLGSFGIGNTNLSLRESIELALDDMFVVLSNMTVAEKNGVSVAMVQNDIFDSMRYRAPFMYGDAISIGCAKGSSIRNQYTVYCGVTPEHIYGSAVYDVGDHCTEHSQCTKPGYDRCDSALGLCHPLVENTNLSYQGCPAGDGIATLNDAARSHIVEYANLQRSKIAKNLALTNLLYGYGGNKAPPASNMKKLVYNCSIETIVQLFANSCRSSLSFPGIYINSVGFVSATRTLEKIIEDSIDTFFRILSNITITQSNGVSVAMVQNDTNELMKFTTSFINGDAISIGCAPSSCIPNEPAFYCGITPVHTYGSALYDVGNPCTQNSHCTKPGYNKCDTSLGLCYP